MLRTIALLLATAPFLPAQTGSAEGTVINRVTGAGIPGVAITLFTRQAVRYETTTDDSGAFRVQGMSPGSYQTLYEKTGFKGFGANPSGSFNIAAGSNPIHIRLEMTRYVTLRGRVLDPDGKPAASVEVKLGYHPGKVTDKGEFTIENIEPGFYPLLASPIGARPIAGQQERTELVPTYFPSVTDLAGAQRITVRGDADLDGYEIKLQSVPVYRVSGIVRDQLGNPATGAKVHLLPVLRQGTRVLSTSNGMFLTIVGPGSATGPEEANAASGADGTFEFPSVRSGDWQVVAETMGSIDSVNYIDTIRSGSTPANVGHADLDRLEILLGTPFMLTGTIDWGDATAQRTMVFLSRGDGPSLFYGDLGANQSNTTFTLARVSTGRYYLLPEAGAGYYPVSVLMGGSEVMGQLVTLVPGAAPIKVSYRKAMGSLSGTVEGATDASVVLLPQQVQTLGFGRIAKCKPDGSFDMAGVMPGDYFAVAVNRLSPTTDELHDPEFLAKVASIGARVRVDQSVSSPIQLKSIRWPE